jgi:hypothetical protein
LSKRSMQFCSPLSSRSTGKMKACECIVDWSSAHRISLGSWSSHHRR